MSANTALINRSLTTIYNELEFLKDSDIISGEFFNQLTDHLPKKYAPNTPMIGPIGGGGAESQRQATPLSAAPVEEKKPPPVPSPVPAPVTETRELVEVMYDFQSDDPSDLTLHRGSRIEVLEKVNNDWWRGRDIDTGSEGLFPSNYVTHSDEKSGLRPSPAPPVSQSYGPPAYSQGAAPIAGGAAALYQQGPPAPQQQYMQPYPQYAQPMQQQQPQQQMVPQDQGSQGHGTLGRIGSKFGNAAIFGAGATLGSDIINHIF